MAKSISALAKSGPSAKLTEYKAGGGMPDAMLVSNYSLMIGRTALNSLLDSIEYRTSLILHDNYETLL